MFHKLVILIFVNSQSLITALLDKWSNSQSLFKSKCFSLPWAFEAGSHSLKSFQIALFRLKTLSKNFLNFCRPCNSICRWSCRRLIRTCLSKWVSRSAEQSKMVLVMVVRPSAVKSLTTTPWNQRAKVTKASSKSSKRFDHTSRPTNVPRNKPSHFCKL